MVWLIEVLSNIKWICDIAYILLSYFLSIKHPYLPFFNFPIQCNITGNWDSDVPKRQANMEVK